MFYSKKVKYLLGLIKKNIKEIILISLLNLLLVTVNYLSLCIGYLKFASFDFQTFLTWNYSAFNNLVPYRDLYYPYGLLPYYKDGNIFFLLTYFFISLITLNVFIYTLKKVFKKNQIVYLTTFIFLIFICLISNLSTFNRYGISVVISMVISYAFYLNLASKKFYFFSGFIISFIFWLVHDQGVLGLTIFFFFYFGNLILKLKSSNKTNLFRLVTNQLLCFLTGAMLGFAPFIYYLARNNALNSFWYYLTVSLPEYPLMSKTPFFNLFFSLNNIFSVGILTFSILFVTYKIYKKKKRSIFTYTEIGLILTIILFEQKNIVRLMENTITFAAFILFAIVLWEIFTKSKKSLESKSLIKITYFSILISVVFVFYISYGNRSGVNGISDISRKPINCYVANMNNTPDVEKYEIVINKLKSYKNFNNKIFSFPGDPIFYVLLNQKQPYFTSVYEASSENSQNIINKYLDNEINYVVINIKNKSIQDEVPNYVRGVFELKYILNNYSIKSVAGDFLILERKNNSDFFIDNKLIGANEYRKYLLDINLESIPFSEGLYKKNIILSEQNTFLVNNFDQMKTNRYLTNNKINSSNTILLIKNSNPGKYTSVEIISEENLETTIKMKSCRENYCIVNLSNIPLFYKNRNIKMINSNEDILVSILKVSNDNIINLW